MFQIFVSFGCLCHFDFIRSLISKFSYLGSRVDLLFYYLCWFLISPYILLETLVV